MRMMVVWVIGLLLVSGRGGAAEQSFYLPGAQRETRAQEVGPFGDLQPGVLGDFMEAYWRWIGDLARFEKALGRPPFEVTSGMRGNKASLVVMQWYVERSREVLQLAKGYQWLENSNDRIEQQITLHEGLPARLRQQLGEWAGGAHRGIRLAHAVMDEEPVEYSMLIMVVTRLGSDPGGEERIKTLAHQRWQRQLFHMKQRYTRVKQHLRRRVQELRAGVELADKR